MIRTFITASAATLCLATGVASADSINIAGSMADSTEGLCNFAGTLEFTESADGLTGILTVSLTNTTAPALGGRITGFLFNWTSSDPATKASLLPGSSHPFKFAQGNGMPFGMNFMAGAALGGNWQGGGNPNPGIAVGATGTFAFLVEANDAADLSAATFVTGPYAHNFVVRFRGLSNGGSDKVPGTPELPPPPPDCPCDINGDGVVDGADLDLIIEAWTYCIENPDCSGELVELTDINGDGITDGADLKLFLICWNACFE